jgi:hypothetical protein
MDERYEVDTMSLHEFLDIVKNPGALPLISLTDIEGAVFAVFFNNGRSLAEEICRTCNAGHNKMQENKNA